MTSTQQPSLIVNQQQVNFHEVLYVHAQDYEFDPNFISLLHQILVLIQNRTQPREKNTILAKLVEETNGVTAYLIKTLDGTNHATCTYDIRTTALTKNNSVALNSSSPGLEDYACLAWELLRSLRQLVCDTDPLVRAQAFRVVRYWSVHSVIILAFLSLGLDFITARAIERDQKFVHERLQAMKFIRLLVTDYPRFITRPLVVSLVAIVENPKEHFRRIAVDTLREIVLVQPFLLASCGGIGALLESLSEPSLYETSSSTVWSLLYLYDLPSTRHLIRPSYDFGKILAAYTDICPTTSTTKDQARVVAHKALLTSFRSFAGIFAFGSDPNCLAALIRVLGLPSGVDGVSWAKEAVFELLYDILHTVTSYDLEIYKRMFIHRSSMAFLESSLTHNTTGVVANPSGPNNTPGTGVGVNTGEVKHHTITPSHTSLRQVNLLHSYMLLTLTICVQHGLIQQLVTLSLTSNDLADAALRLLTEVLRLACGLFPRAVATQIQTLAEIFHRAVSLYPTQTTSTMISKSTIAFPIDTSVAASAFDNTKSYTNPQYLVSLINSTNPFSDQKTDLAQQTSSLTMIRVKSFQLLSKIFQESIAYLTGPSSSNSFHELHAANTALTDTSSSNQGVQSIGKTTEGIIRTSFIDHGFNMSRLALETDNTPDRHLFIPTATGRPHLKSNDLHTIYVLVTSSHSESLVMQQVKATNVLSTKDPFVWDWSGIYNILETYATNRHHFQVIIKTKFFKRLLSFMRPEKRMFSDLYYTIPHAMNHGRVALQLIRVMVTHQEGREYQFFHELLEQLIDMLSEEAHRAEIFSQVNVTNHPAHFFIQRHIRNSEHFVQSEQADYMISPSLVDYTPTPIRPLNSAPSNPSGIVAPGSPTFTSRQRGKNEKDRKFEPEESSLRSSIVGFANRFRGTTMAPTAKSQDTSQSRTTNDENSVLSTQKRTTDVTLTMNPMLGDIFAGGGRGANLTSGHHLTTTVEEDAFQDKFRPFSRTNMYSRLCREYVSVFGELSSTTHGCSLLSRYGFFELVTGLASSPNHDYLTRAFLFSLDFSHSSHCRQLLEHWILSGTTYIRRSVISLLRTVLRENHDNFPLWALDLSISLLYSPDTMVSLPALSLVEEAISRDMSCLPAVIKRAPNLTHFGSFINNIYFAFLSVPEGLQKLIDNGWLVNQLHIWDEMGCDYYLSSSEHALSISLSPHIDIAVGDDQLKEQKDDSNSSAAGGASQSSTTNNKAQSSSTTTGNTSKSNTSAPICNEMLANHANLYSPLSYKPPSFPFSQYSLHHSQHWQASISVDSEFDDYMRKRNFKIPWSIELVIETQQRRNVQLLVDTFILEGVADSGQPIISHLAKHNPNIASYYQLGNMAGGYKQSNDGSAMPSTPGGSAAIVDTAHRATIHTRSQPLRNKPTPLLRDGEFEGTMATYVCGLVLDIDGKPHPFEIDPQSTLHARLCPFVLSSDSVPIGSSAMRVTTQDSNPYSNFIPQEKTKIITAQYLDTDSIQISASQPISPAIRKCYPLDRHELLIPSFYATDYLADIYCEQNTRINTQNWSEVVNNTTPPKTPAPAGSIPTLPDLPKVSLGRSANDDDDDIPPPPPPDDEDDDENNPTSRTLPPEALDSVQLSHITAFYSPPVDLAMATDAPQEPIPAGSIPFDDPTRPLHPVDIHALSNGSTAVHCRLPTFHTTSYYYLDGNTRWNFYVDPDNGKMYITSIWFRLHDTHDILPSVSFLPHLYSELAKTERGCSLLLNSGILHKLTRRVVVEDFQNFFSKRSAAWSLASIGASETGMRLLIRCGIPPIIAHSAMHSPMLSFRGTCFYLMGLFGLSPIGRKHLNLLGWDANEEDAQISSLGVALPRNIIQFLHIPEPQKSHNWALHPENIGGVPHVPFTNIEAGSERYTTEDTKQREILQRYEALLRTTPTAEPPQDALELILGHISNLCNHVSQRLSLNMLRAYKQSFPLVFASYIVYAHVLDLLNKHSFSLPARRFILFDLFSTVDLTAADQLEQLFKALLTINDRRVM